MQDASKSKSAACNKFYPNLMIVMCYYHVKSNCEKNLSNNSDYATINTCESFNKRLKKDFTGFKEMHILDCFEKVIEKAILTYSEHK